MAARLRGPSVAQPRAGSRTAHGLVWAAASVLAWAVLVLPAAPSAASAAPRWSGGMDVYRPGTYSMQQTWQWCTAADVQMARNIAFGQADHSAGSQRTYFDWMRAHNRYDIPVSDGVDPHGWTQGLQHFVDSRYRLVASTSFDSVMRAAVVAIRRTSLPVAMVVDNGNHGWLLTGFTTTADPAATFSFSITAVRVVGPLFGRQSRNGYDMPPDSSLTYAALRHFLTPFRDFHAMMAWDGMFVTMQPDPTAARTPGSPAAGAAAGAPRATRQGHVTGTPAPAGASSIAPRRGGFALPSPTGSTPAAILVAGHASGLAPRRAQLATAESTGPPGTPGWLLAALGCAGLLVAGGSLHRRSRGGLTRRARVGECEPGSSLNRMDPAAAFSTRPPRRGSHGVRHRPTASAPREPCPEK